MTGNVYFWEFEDGGDDQPLRYSKTIIGAIRNARIISESVDPTPTAIRLRKYKVRPLRTFYKDHGIIPYPAIGYFRYSIRSGKALQ